MEGLIKPEAGWVYTDCPPRLTSCRQSGNTRRCQDSMGQVTTPGRNIGTYYRAPSDRSTGPVEDLNDIPNNLPRDVHRSGW